MQVAGEMFVIGDGDCGQLGKGEDVSEALRPAPSPIPGKQASNTHSPAWHQVLCWWQVGAMERMLKRLHGYRRRRGMTSPIDFIDPVPACRAGACARLCGQERTLSAAGDPGGGRGHAQRGAHSQRRGVDHRGQRRGRARPRDRHALALTLLSLHSECPPVEAPDARVVSLQRWMHHTTGTLASPAVFT